MDQSSVVMREADELEELHQFSPPAARTAHKPDKVRYTHQDMIDFLIANPSVSQGIVASRYGYTEAWVSRIITSDAFQAQLAARRAEIINPELVATVEERFRALATRSVQRLMHELDRPACKPEVMLAAASLGAKALGIGGHAPPPAPPPGDHLLVLSQRLINLNHPPEAINGEAQRLPDAGEVGQDSHEVHGPATLSDESGEGAGGREADAGSSGENAV